MLPGVLEECFPDTMDEDLRGKYDEEVIVLPNKEEARMLTDSLTLEVLFKGRPKSAGLGIPQVHQQAEQLRCLLRLSRVSPQFNVRPISNVGVGKVGKKSIPACSLAHFM